MYKVSLQTQGRFKGEEYVDKTVLLLVSVGKEYHQGEKLAATIQKINQSGFSKCIIAVADTLQRHNLSSMPSQEGHAKSRIQGDKWLEDHESIISSLNIPYKISRWDDFLKRDDYHKYYYQIINEYYSNESYRSAIHETIGIFTQRKNLAKGTLEYDEAFYRSLFYILEECPIIMPMWADEKIDFIIYPKQMTLAMSMTRDISLNGRKSEYANWISLKFKKISNSHNKSPGGEPGNV